MVRLQLSLVYIYFDVYLKLNNVSFTSASLTSNSLFIILKTSNWIASFSSFEFLKMFLETITHVFHIVSLHTCPGYEPGIGDSRLFQWQTDHHKPDMPISWRWHDIVEYTHNQTNLSQVCWRFVSHSPFVCPQPVGVQLTLWLESDTTMRITPSISKEASPDINHVLAWTVPSLSDQMWHFLWPPGF